MFRSLPSVVVASLIALLAAQSPASAQELVAANTLSSAVLFPAAPLEPAPATTVANTEAANTVTANTVTANTEAANAASATVVTPLARFTRASVGAPSRPSLLPALYAAQVALQAMDVRTTFAAISNGAHEANPLMQPFAKNQGAMLGVKAAVAASTIWMSEKMWRRGNRVGAIVSMVMSNAITAVVVAHNYQLNSQLQLR